MKKALPQNITSYDLLKAVAVIIMITDHLGYYFFTDDLWWRAVGRIGFPVWFFLIGHARGREIPARLWGGALFLSVLYVVCGSHLFPLNALVTIIFIRVTLDYFMKESLLQKVAFAAMAIALMILIFPSAYIMEYGTQAVIVAMFGYLVRHKQERGFSKDFVRGFAVFAFFTFVIPQFMMHGLSLPQFYLMAGGTALTFYILLNFQAAQYQGLTEKLPAPVAALIRLGGRRTLEIYVLHITIFQLIALKTDPARFGLFDWNLFPAF